MARNQLAPVLRDLRRTLAECLRLAADAHSWSAPGARPRLSVSRRDWMIELAFFRAFLAWEVFLEESFILYMLGRSPVRGRAPHRFVLPPNRKAAQVLAAEGREYAKWDAMVVSARAERFFRKGGHFTDAIRLHQFALNGAKTLRNAVAHDSANAREKFEALARSELTTLPPELTIGDFLNRAKAGTTSSYLTFYLEKIQLTAEQIAGA